MTATAQEAPPAVPELTLRMHDAMMRIASDMLDDSEEVRIATANRYRQATTTEPDEDGIVRGFGLPEDHPAVLTLKQLMDQQAATEKGAEALLIRQFRQHPLYPFAKAQKGLGDRQTARLLAVLGDPAWHSRDDRRRTLGELYAYTGYHVVNVGAPDGPWIGCAPRRIRGQRANWHGVLKMRVFLIAETCVKGLRTPCAKTEGDPFAVHAEGLDEDGAPLCRCYGYRKVYDEARRRYQHAEHVGVCVRCGPVGAPALPGSPLSLKHQHGRGVRAVSKRILEDLWTESCRLHGWDPQERPSA